MRVRQVSAVGLRNAGGEEACLLALLVVDEATAVKTNDRLISIDIHYTNRGEVGCEGYIFILQPNDNMYVPARLPHHRIMPRIWSHFKESNFYNCGKSFVLGSYM
jgi:hypothetical protein